jgi:hypothetical protein
MATAMPTQTAAAAADATRKLAPVIDAGLSNGSGGRASAGARLAIAFEYTCVAVQLLSSNGDALLIGRNR